MAAILVTIVSTLAAGIAVALAVDRRASGMLLLGMAYLYGTGLVFVAMLALSVLHIRWTLLSAAVAVLLGCCLGARRLAAAIPRQRPAAALHVIDLATLLTLIGYTAYATLAPLWEWDFWAIWGLKARVFLEHGGIDWRFLESRWNIFAHTDYPLLVPLNYDFASLVAGGWSDRWLGLFFVAWAVAATLIVRALAAQEATPLVAALVTLAVGPIAASHYVGLAEGPLVVFGGTAVLFLRRALATDDAAAWRHGAIFLGLAANCKNEGLALLVAVAIAMIAVRRGRIVRLWPAIALAAPWLLLRATHTLPTDIVGGSVVERVIARLPILGRMARFLSEHLFNPWFWVALLVGILIAPAARRRREAFVLIVTFVQLAFYIGSYVATPHDPRWHIVTSWPRLTVQLSLPITYAVIMMLAVSFSGAPESADAEARPDQ